MTLAVVSSDTDGVNATIEGVTARIPRSLANGDYQRLLDFSMKKIEMTRGVYNAFPSAIFASGTSLAAIFSNGAGHGNSDRQIGLRTDDQFATFQRSVYFEDAGAVFDNSFLDGMLATGDVVLFKNVFKTRKTISGYENTTQSIVVQDDYNCAIWHAAPVFTGGKHYCTGYRATYSIGTISVANGGTAVTGVGTSWLSKIEPGEILVRGSSRATILSVNSDTSLTLAAAWPGGTLSGSTYSISVRTRTLLFESSDKGWTWTYNSTIAADPALAFSEAAIVKALNGDLVALIREDSGAGRPLYLARSSAGVSSWSTPALLSDMQGTQPCLLLLPDGDILLLVGHRTGFTGLDLSGVLNEAGGTNITGIACWRSGNHGVTWSNRVILAPMWSTDGGQPMATVLDGTGRVGMLCYLAPGSTNADYGVEPGIYWVTFQGNNIV